MQNKPNLHRLLLGSIFSAGMLVANAVSAGGEIGDHVNQLADNMNAYEDEVVWLIEKTDEIVKRYENKGKKAANADQLIEHWEHVNFHAAIETSYVPIYAYIWQGLFGVKEAINSNQPIAAVLDEQDKLEQALWQALGSVKLAANYQKRGLLEQIQTREGAPTNSIEALESIETQLDRVVAKYAEKLNDVATDLVHDTYLNIFEGVEGELISLDAELVEDLEKDFNVTLPKAIKAEASVNDVRKIVDAMQAKIGTAKALLKTVKKNKKSVF